MRTQLEDYCRWAKIVMEKASTYHPEINGAAESSVKQVKNLYRKCRMDGQSKEEALFIFQATPRSAGELSPARMFYNRDIRIPQLPKLEDERD